MRSLVIALVLITVLYSCAAQRLVEFSASNNNKREVKIAKGAPVTVRGEFAHQVAIVDRNDKSQYCGGTLIAAQYVLTAAHCYDDGTNSAIIIDRNDLTSTSNGALVGVLQVIKHPNYDKASLNNDIALLKLETQVAETPYVKYASLEDKEYSIGDMLWVTGWGKTEAGTSSNVLRKLQTPITSGNKCATFGSFVANTMVCAGDGTGADACPGDSGGPLGRFSPINGRFVVGGVTSWGPAACGEVGSYGAYAKVKTYIPWIQGYVPNLMVGVNATSPPPLPIQTLGNGANSISINIVVFTVTAIVMLFACLLL